MNTKKRLLIFIDWFYPGFRGGGPIVSIYNLVLELGSDYDIYIFTSAYDYTEKDILKQIKTDEWVDFKQCASVYYRTTVNPLVIWKTLTTIQPDIIHLNSMFSLKFTVLPLLISKFFIKQQRRILLAPRGMLIDGNFQFKKFKKTTFLGLFKLFQLHKNIFGHAASEQEVNSIQKKLGLDAKNILLAKNIPNKFLLEKRKIATKTPQKLIIYFASRIGREKNILFSLQVLKELNIPITFIIHGNVDHNDYWEECERFIDTLPDTINVIYKGTYQTFEIATLFEKYHVFLFPSNGENFSHVIFEALALGKPVITTPEMPWNELEIRQAGWLISLDNKEHYKKVIRELFESNQQAYNVLSNAAYEYAREHTETANYKQTYRLLLG